ncbi:hypothetical protein BUALT_Bualt14G0084600 [Buddleja alternifolia]|uniref:serine O-acetyltransferase n=1 Tax=Buddleja alternifolia TaxID=168488 RepID=A0AAV6WNW4_9LAMI|nr:hypothetical protein BUALT_Bualt14G0084600 [Buddleja alternifolia]
MAACLNNSANHCIFITSDSSKCHKTSLYKIISNVDFCSTKFNNPCKVNPQEINEDQIWLKIREKAQFDLTQEPILSKYYNSIILNHNSLESALANHLSIKLCNANLSKESLYDVFLKVLLEDINIQQAVKDDLKAVKEQDPACISFAQCFLNFKEFLACQAHRIAHSFWLQGTGKVEGDRHPKIGDGVLIGAGAKVWGNVKVGENAKIGAGSVVLKDISPRATAVGVEKFMTDMTNHKVMITGRINPQKVMKKLKKKTGKRVELVVEKEDGKDGEKEEDLVLDYSAKNVMDSWMVHYYDDSEIHMMFNDENANACSIM